MPQFANREDAGKKLAAMLSAYAEEDPVVVALPRGGVPVGAEVARALDAPLEILVVRKVGAPAFPELGMGAVAEGGILYLDPRITDRMAPSDAELEALVEQKELEVRDRVRAFRGARPREPLRDRTVILVDDGIATGGTTRAALLALRKEEPRRIVLAVPVAARESLDQLAPLADAVVCPLPAQALYAISAYYDDFRQVSDDEVVKLLDASRGQRHVVTREIAIHAQDSTLQGTFSMPEDPVGLVIFAHGSGSGRFSPRNQFVARVLNEHRIATLLFDLLTVDEEREDEATGQWRFDIDLLAERLIHVTDWSQVFPEALGLPVGLFGSSTGAAAAMMVAAERPELVRAVVSRGGRVDLAEKQLGRVQAPALLIVGERDKEVLELNERALRRLSGPRLLVVIPGATHLFEEEGALDEVARHAATWLVRNLLESAAEEQAPR